MTKKDIPVTVVIAAFNEETRLPFLLKSLEKQTLKNFKTIIVDNNSTDKTAKIATDWGATVIKETRQGIGPAKRKGINTATTPIIAIIDADTVLPFHWLETAVKNLNEPGVVATTGVYYYQNYPKIFWQANRWLHFLVVKIINTLVGGCFAFKKEAWEKSGGYPADLIWAEDAYLSHQFAKIGKIKIDIKLAVAESGRKMNLKGFLRGNLSYIFYFIIFKLSRNSNLLKKIKMEKVDKI